MPCDQHLAHDQQLLTMVGCAVAVLQCAVLGQDLRSHTKYAFQPGEARELQLATAEEPGFFSSKTFKCMDPPKCSVRRQV